MCKSFIIFSSITLLLSCNEGNFDSTQKNNPQKAEDQNLQQGTKPSTPVSDKNPTQTEEKVEHKEVTVSKEEVEEVVHNCENSAKKHSQVLNFGEEANGCWGADQKFRSQDVLGFKNRYYQAMVKQSRKVDLPKNAVICDIKFNFDEQMVYFDDEIFLTYNGLLLTGSNNKHIAKMITDNKLKTTEGIVIWDWKPFLNKEFPMEKPIVYCAGSNNTCIIPKTQTVGKFVLNFNTDFIKKATLAVTKMNNGIIQAPEFSLITTGDNDGKIDCKHSPINMKVDVTYYIP